MPFDGLRRRVTTAADALLGKTKELGEKTTEIASEGIRSVSETAQQAHQSIKTAHYNPIFPEDYASPDFDLPDMIVIEDEDQRKGVDVCEGSIGWLSKEAGIGVLHLYKEAIQLSGLAFFPIASCEAVYYADPFNSERFIELSSYYDVMQKDKLTELRNIAYALGAKECELTSYEAVKTIRRRTAKGDIKGKAPDGLRAGISAEGSSSESAGRETKLVFKSTFEGSDEPSVPELHWYEHDRELASLIAMRCSDGSCGAIREHFVEIDCSASSTLSTTRACRLDAAMKKLGAICNFSLKSESEVESRRHFIYHIMF